MGLHHIGTHCTALESFKYAYFCSPEDFYEDEFPTITSAGVGALSQLANHHKLKSVHIDNRKGFPYEFDFSPILRTAANNIFPSFPPSCALLNASTEDDFEEF